VVPPVPTPGATGAHCATPAATPGACFDPSYLKHNTDLYQSLSHSTTMNALGMNLATSASKAIGTGIIHALPYIILIAIVGVTGWIQQKQIQGRTPASQVPQQQQAVMKIMPFFLPIISIGLPAGLVLYFAVSNTYRVAQQWFISRSIYGPADSGGTEGNGAKPIAPKGSGGTTTKPKQGRMAAALSAAAAKAEVKDQANGSTQPATKNPGRPASTKAKSSSTDAASKPSPAKKSTSSGRVTKSPSKQTSKDTERGSNGSKTTDDTSATPKPVLQPRARKKKE
jgi:YidC/Oxa1 family membrane protein insertase